MRKPLEIAVPTAEEFEALENLYRTTRDVRLRTRAQIGVTISFRDFYTLGSQAASQANLPHI